MRRYLVVANETATSSALLDKVRGCIEAGPSQFHIVVPVKHPTGAWSEGQVTSAARSRLTEAIAAFEEAGAEVTGEVGDANPLNAVGDVLLNHAIDEIILATLPAGPSRWLRQDVPTRLTRRYAIPLTHVVAAPVTVP